MPAGPENKPRAGHFSGSIDTDYIAYGDNTITVTLKTTRSKYQVSCRNLESVEVLPVSDLNSLSLLRCNNLVMTADAFEEIQGIEAQHVAGGGN